jgi:hypothetical protein
MPRLTRRRLLAGLGGAAGLGVVGATVYHAYTGPVTLAVENYVRERLSLDTRISHDSSVVHEATYELPAFAPTDQPDTSGTGRVKEQVVDHAVRGTTYTVEASTETRALTPGADDTYRVTCTGYADIERPDGTEKRLADRISLSVRPSPEAGISLGGPYCESVWE